MLIKNVYTIDNHRVFENDTERWNTDKVCSLCGKATSVYIAIPMIWECGDELIMCKSCINICEMKINETYRLQIDEVDKKWRDSKGL